MNPGSVAPPTGPSIVDRTRRGCRWGYRAYAVACGSLIIVGSVVLVGFDPPRASVLIPLAALLILTEQRDRLFGDETSISSSIVVAMAAVAAFDGAGELSGPLVCAACAGLYWPHLRDRAISKIAINAFSMGTAALLATLVFNVIVGEATPSIVLTLVASVPAALAFWAGNSFILAIAVALLSGERFFHTIGVLIRSETEMLFFAVGGAGCGYVIANESEGLGLGSLVLLLVAVDLLVIRRPRGAIRIGAPAKRLPSVLSAAVAVAGLVTVAVLAVVEPLPEALPTAVLSGVAAVVAGLGPRLARQHQLAVNLIVSLVAVGVLYDSSPVLGPSLVAVVGGGVLALRSSGDGMVRRLTLIGASVVPALAAGVAVAALPVRPSDGVGAVVVVAAAAGIAALLARVVTTSTSIAGVGLSGVLVALGDAVADWWIVVLGAAAVAAGWYSLVAGLGVIVFAIVVSLWLERRTAGVTQGDSDGIGHLSDEGLVDAITAALCDRPGAPTSLPSS